MEYSSRVSINEVKEVIYLYIYRVQKELESNHQPDCILYNSKLSEFDLQKFTKKTVWILVNIALEVK